MSIVRVSPSRKKWQQKVERSAAAGELMNAILFNAKEKKSPIDFAQFPVEIQEHTLWYCETECLMMLQQVCKMFASPMVDRVAMKQLKAQHPKLRLQSESVPAKVRRLQDAHAAGCKWTGVNRMVSLKTP